MPSRVHPDDIQLETWSRNRIRTTLQAEIDGVATDDDVVERVELMGALMTMSRVPHNSKGYQHSRKRLLRVQRGEFDFYASSPAARRSAVACRSR